MDELKSYPTTTLLKLIRAKEFKSLSKILGPKVIARAVGKTHQYLHQEFGDTTRSLTLIRLMNSTARVPLIILLALIPLVQMSMSTLLFAIGTTLLMTGLMGYVLYFSMKKELEQKKKTMVENVVLAVIQQEAGKTLLIRQMACEKKSHRLLPPLLYPETHTHFFKPTHLKPLVMTALETCGALFITYFLGSRPLIDAMGVSPFIFGALSGNLGLFIALAMSLVVGLHFGYKDWKAHQESNYCQKWQQQAETFLQKEASVFNKIEQKFSTAKPLIGKIELSLSKALLAKRSLAFFPSTYTPSKWVKNHKEIPWDIDMEITLAPHKLTHFNGRVFEHPSIKKITPSPL